MTDKQTMIPVIICGGAQGRAVIYGYVKGVPHPEQPVTIHRARMVLRWEGRRGLLALAKHGPEEGSRITCSVPMVRDTARQVIVVSPEAALALDGWPDAA